MTENISHKQDNDSRDLRTTDSGDASVSCETKPGTENKQENPTVLKSEHSKLVNIAEQVQITTFASKVNNTNDFHYGPIRPDPSVNSIRQCKVGHNDVQRDKVDPKLLVMSQAVRITTLYLKIDRFQIYQLHQQKNKMRFKSVHKNNKNRPKIPAPAAGKIERAQNTATTKMMAPVKFQQLRQHVTVATLYEKINRVQIHQLHDQQNRMKPKPAAQINQEYAQTQVTQKVSVTTDSNETDDHKYQQSIVATKKFIDNQKGFQVENDDLSSRHEAHGINDWTVNDKGRAESSLEKKDVKTDMVASSNDTNENGLPDPVISDDTILLADSLVGDKNITELHNVKKPDEISKPSDEDIGVTEAKANTLKKEVPNVEKIKSKKEEDKRHLISKSNTGKPKLMHLRNHIGVATLYQRLDRAQIYQLHEQRNRMKIGHKAKPAKVNGQADPSSKKVEDKQNVMERREPTAKQKTNAPKHTYDKKVNEPTTEKTSDRENEKNISNNKETKENKQQKETEYDEENNDAKSTTNGEYMLSEVNMPKNEIRHTDTFSGESCIDKANDSSSPKERYTQEDNVGKSLCETDQEEQSYDICKLFHSDGRDEKADIVSDKGQFRNIENKVQSKINEFPLNSKVSVEKYCVNEGETKVKVEDSCDMLHPCGKKESSTYCDRHPATIEEMEDQSAPDSRTDNNQDTNWKPGHCTERLLAMSDAVHGNTDQTNDDDNALQMTMVEDNTDDEEDDVGMFGILSVYAMNQMHVDFLY